MANSNRIYKNKNGNMFIPMNVEGGTWNEHFINVPKLVALGITIFLGVIIILRLGQVQATFGQYLTVILLYLFCAQLVIRYIVFEEKYFYKMYLKMKENEITTPALFWNITSIKETEFGDILIYSDGKIGVILKLERDTIVGGGDEHREAHYDAISDFYRDILNKRYSMVQLNLMETAGNDPRMENLNKLITKSDNRNIRRLMEMQIGYLKNIIHNTLYETEYILVYANDISRIDAITRDVSESAYKILSGGYTSFNFLKTKDIIELVKQLYGVKYFNHVDATLHIFKEHRGLGGQPFKITGIIFKDGRVKNVENLDLNSILKLTSKEEIEEKNEVGDGGVVGEGKAVEVREENEDLDDIVIDF